MINCEDFSNIMSDYLEGGISESRTSAINSHLVTCQTCKLLLNRTDHIVKSIKSLQQVKASDSFQDRLQERLREEIELEKAKGLRRLSRSVGSVPVKPVFATLTAAAAITAVSIVAGNQFIEEERSAVPVATPRISTPPLPGQNTGQTLPLQKSLMQQTRTASSITENDSLKDKTSIIDRNSPGSQEILKNLRAQSQAVRDVKENK